MTYQLHSNWQTSTIRTKSGLKIRYGVWTQIPVEEVSRWLVFINGRTEFIEKYDYLPQDLKLPTDVGLVTWDHRGQGASEGRIMHVDNFRDYVSDAEQVLSFVVGAKPYSIMSHSMGGLVSSLGVCLQALKPERLILLSPYLELSEKIVNPTLGRALAKIFLALGLGEKRWPLKRETSKPFQENRLTTDLERFERLKQFRRFSEAGPSIRWIQASIEAMEFIRQDDAIKNVSMPVTMLIGSLDAIVGYQGAHDWMNLVKAKNPKTFVKDFSDAKHELLSERSDVYGETLQLIRRALSN